MATREDMLDSLDSLKMLAFDGVFANKEGNAGTKVAPMPNGPPVPQTNAAQQALQTHEERLRAFKDGLDTFKAELNEQDDRQQKKKLELDELERKLRQKEVMIESVINMNKNTYTAEREKNEKERRRLEEMKNSLLTRGNDLWRQKHELTELKEKYQYDQGIVRSLEIRLQTKMQKADNLKEQLEREQNSLKKEKEKVNVELEQEKEKVKQSEKKREDLIKTVNMMMDGGHGAALSALKTFVCMWKDELLTLSRPDKLRCIIPHDTTTWFKATYYRLDEARKLDFMMELGRVSDVYYRDLRVDINTATPRFVIFYRQKKLIEYANEKWDGNLVRALYNMHHKQEDDRDKVDERIKLTER